MAAWACTKRLSLESADWFSGSGFSPRARSFSNGTLPGAGTALVEINLHVLRRATGGDNVELPVAVQVCDSQVFTGHRVVVDQCHTPVVAFLVERYEELNADFDARLVHRAPANNNLVRAKADEVATCERVAVHQRSVQDMAGPQDFAVVLRGRSVRDEVCAVHGLDRGKEPFAAAQLAQPDFARSAAFGT